MFSEFYDGDTMKAIELGDAFDLAYICEILAAIGNASSNIDRKRMPYIYKGKDTLRPWNRRTRPGKLKQELLSGNNNRL